MDLRNFKTLGSRGNEVTTLNITFVVTVPLWIFFFSQCVSFSLTNPLSKHTSASRVCMHLEEQVPASPVKCGRYVRRDMKRTVKLSGMKQPYRSD